MFKQLATVKHRLATRDEEVSLASMSDDDTEDFMYGAEVCRDDTILYAVVNGVAYNMARVAKLKQMLSEG